MTKDNIIKLDLQTIEREAKQFDSMSRGFISINAKNYEVGIRDKFTELEIQEVLKDLIDFLEEATKVEEKTSVDLLVFTQPYITTLLVKHFTDMAMPEDIYETIAVAKNMINLGVLNQLIALFPQEELTRAMERISEALESTNETLDALTKEATEIRKGKLKAQAKLNAKQETLDQMKESNELIDEALNEARLENEVEEDGK